MNEFFRIYLSLCGMMVLDFGLLLAQFISKYLSSYPSLGPREGKHYRSFSMVFSKIQK